MLPVSGFFFAKMLRINLPSDPTECVILLWPEEGYRSYVRKVALVTVCYNNYFY